MRWSTNSALPPTAILPFPQQEVKVLQPILEDRPRAAIGAISQPRVGRLSEQFLISKESRAALSAQRLNIVSDPAINSNQITRY
jgi:hypothetical protein